MELSAFSQDELLREFWLKMSEEESTHIEFWKKVRETAGELGLPSVFDDSILIRDELAVMEKKSQYFGERMEEVPKIRRRIHIGLPVRIRYATSWLRNAFQFIEADPRGIFLGDHSTAN